ncbi:hypothetical protein HPB50_005036 [Hyalomma asiaticum]|uniref:Uncharacterized protein n=1 Tax=Hyalomma asiaticum TaxID=266040 RepID=A0ACB7SV51_HYAAI|nr:hypothetical protein HPB50_005036 [Hyalomma asiaticum]
MDQWIAVLLRRWRNGILPSMWKAESTKKLESSGAALTQSVELMLDVQERFATVPNGPVADRVTAKLKAVLDKNPGFYVLKKVSNVLSGTDSKIPGSNEEGDVLVSGDGRQQRSEMGNSDGTAGEVLNRDTMDALWDMRNSGVLCDGLLKTADGGKFPVHRVVMASCSEYFKVLFSSHLSRDNQCEVLVHGVSSEALAIIVEFAYKRITWVGCDNCGAAAQGGRLPLRHGHG